MVLYAIINGTEIGVKLNSEEVEALGAGFVSVFSDPEMSKAYFDMLSKIGEAANEAAEKKDPEPEKEHDEEEDDTDYEKERDRLIRELRDLGCEVKMQEEEVVPLLNCVTFESGGTKFGFVKSWLKTNKREFDEKNSITGRKMLEYKLTTEDIYKLNRYLKEVEADGSSNVIV